MTLVKLTPIRYRRSIFWWPVVLIVVYALQVSNFFMSFFTGEAKEYLDMYSYVLTLISMLSLWLNSCWRADNATARAVSRKAFYWINFIAFANLAILLYVNSQSSANTCVWTILGITAIGILAGIIATIKGCFNLDIMPEKPDETDINKAFINNDVYLWAGSMLAVFYVIATNFYFNYLNDTIYSFLNIFCLQGAVFFLLNFYGKKTRKALFENNDRKRTVSRTIMPWMYSLSISQLLFYFVIGIIPQESIPSRLIVCISITINTIFTILLCFGRFRKK